MTGCPPSLYALVLVLLLIPWPLGRAQAQDSLPEGNALEGFKRQIFLLLEEDYELKLEPEKKRVRPGERRNRTCPQWNSRQKFEALLGPNFKYSEEFDHAFSAKAGETIEEVIQLQRRGCSLLAEREGEEVISIKGFRLQAPGSHWPSPTLSLADSRGRGRGPVGRQGEQKRDQEKAHAGVLKDPVRSAWAVSLSITPSWTKTRARIDQGDLGIRELQDQQLAWSHMSLAIHWNLAEKRELIVRETHAWPTYTLEEGGHKVFRGSFPSWQLEGLYKLEGGSEISFGGGLFFGQRTVTVVKTSTTLSTAAVLLGGPVLLGEWTGIIKGARPWALQGEYHLGPLSWETSGNSLTKATYHQVCLRFLQRGSWKEITGLNIQSVYEWGPIASVSFLSSSWEFPGVVNQDNLQTAHSLGITATTKF